MRSAMVFLSFLFLLIAGAAPSLAQSSAAGQPSAAKVEQLLDLLKDPEIQTWLEARPTTGGAESPMQSTVAVRAALSQAIDKWLIAAKRKAERLPRTFARLPAELAAAEREILAANAGRDVWLSLLFIPVFLAVGYGCEWLFWRVTRRLRHAVLDSPHATLWDRVRLLLVRALFAALSVFTFGLFSVGAFLAFDWPSLLAPAVASYLTAFIFLRFSMIFGRLVLSPRSLRLRLLPLDDGSAQFIYRAVAILVGLSAFGYVTLAVLQDFGFSPASRDIAGSLVTLALAIVAMAAIRGGRQSLVSASDMETRAANAGMIDAWPLMAMGALLVAWLLGLFDAGALAWSIVVLLALPLLLLVCRAILSTVLRVPSLAAEAEADAIAAGDETGEALDMPALSPPAKIDTSMTAQRPYPLAFDRLLRAIIFLGGLYAIASLWGLDLLALAGSDSLAARFIDASFRILVTLIIADFTWQVIKGAIDRRMPEIVIDEDETPGEIARATRLQTLLPLLRHFVMILVIAISALICLSALGLDIGPLLAGAGIAGIAIGFGAQALVKDVVSGLFFLIDDAFRIGEYIESGEIRGVVEGFSLRSVRLRHHRGHLHTVPFGELKSVTNYSRDWVIDKLEFGVTYDTDLDLVRKVIKRVGQEMLSDPELARVILEPLKSQGVVGMGDYAINIRAKIKTRPGEQFIVRREAYRRIKRAFDAAGIKFAFPTVAVQGGDAAVAAAQAALIKDQATKPTG